MDHTRTNSKTARRLVLKEGASDLHLSDGRTPIIRVSGVLIPLVKKPVLTDDDMKGFVDEFLSPDNQKILRRRQGGRFLLQPHGNARFRGNAYFQPGMLVDRAAPHPARSSRTLAELNLPPILETFTRKPQGFFLVVGPVGQGKTTTLAALIEIINQTRAEHILTIEDPIEYLFESKKSIIDQREVRIDTTDFHDALIGMFREDINVCLVGEMRDIETIAHGRDRRRDRPPRSSRPSIPTTPPRPSTASSTRSRRTSRTRSASSSPARSPASSPSASCRASPAASFRRTSS